MDPNSPFAYRNEESSKIVPTKVVHVNFCVVCHYVWKAPAPPTKCVNCKQDGNTAVSLTNYISEVPVT